ncbi:spermidine/putrescine ABC transporter substrate-binding protein [Moritella marina ATCC 15381]|uniref:Spermidine/putrescine ABC transporter substrate-binding protein n=1 Tax=Moritella marina ATCC 15381 TaxID=1202962 RepID=A0A5J6WLL3_MORMI|nr:spermidine/putrescine ABC transporter substrate-binding protein [Moritella marina]QFI38101.1 spermidine/putrescine ABC transporter substrate-binding protein [Moritella marina ATCC 15381]
MKSICLPIILMLSVIFRTAQADEIQLFTWEEYFSDEVIKRFEAETNHTVNQIYFENESLRDQVMYSGKAAAYDLVILDGYTLSVLGEKGILSQLDNALSDDLPFFTEQSEQACHDYGIPYAYGTIGIGFRNSKVKETISSWMDVFDYAKKNPGRVIIPDEDMDTVAIALMALGYNPMSKDILELKQAFTLLQSVIGDLLVFRNGLGYALDKGKESKMDMAVFYSGEKEQISIATAQDDWEYIIPDEGTLVWHECLSSHTKKPMKSATIEFLRYINNPVNAAKNAQDIWFTTANKDALKWAHKDYTSDKELFPTELTSSKYYHYQRLDYNALKVRANIINVLSNQ